jgi:hypothetical protein
MARLFITAGLITGIRSDIGGWAQAWRRSLEYSIAANCGACPHPQPLPRCAGEGSYWRPLLAAIFLVRAIPPTPPASGGAARYNQICVFVNMFTIAETFGGSLHSQ